MKALVSLGIVFTLAAFSLAAQAPSTPTFSLDPGDVTEAVVNSSGPARLKVTLTPAKSAELANFTELNVNMGLLTIKTRFHVEPNGAKKLVCVKDETESLFSSIAYASDCTDWNGSPSDSRR